MRRAILLVLALLACIPATAAAGPALPLGHAGRWITDAQGRVVVLHGLNMVYKLAPYEPSAAGFGEKDAALLASAGFDAVRVGVIYKAVEPEPGVYDEGYLDSIAATVHTLESHGLVSLLDFHQDLYNQRYQGEGFPDWAALDDGLPAQPQVGFANNYFAMPALNRAFDNFWSDAPGPGGVGLQERFAAAWGHVSSRFATDPGVLGYEILNEPWPGTTWPQCANLLGCPLFDAELGALYTKVDRAIRAADPRTLVFYEPNVLFNYDVPTTLPPLGDPRAAMAFHDYCLTSDVTGSQVGCDTLGAGVFDNADRHVQATGDGLLMSEFGAIDTPAVLDPPLQSADDHRVSWLEWAYCACGDPTGNPATEGLVNDPRKPLTAANVKQGELAILARPYPQVVSGTPIAWGYAADRHAFDLAYRTLQAADGAPFPPGARTEISVPAIEYPSGYRVSVAGARVTSAARAPVLALAACPGAGAVSVTVTPGSGVRQTCASPPPPAAAAPAAPRRALRVLVRPSRVRAGRSTRVSILVRAGGAPVRGAHVSVAGRRALSSARGRAVLVVRPSRPEVLTVRVSARGLPPGRARLRVLATRGA